MALTVVSSPLCSSGFGAAAEDLAVVASGSPVSVHGKRRVGGEASGLLRRRSLPRSTQEACNSGDFDRGGGSSLRRCVVVKMVRGGIGTVLLSRPNEAAVLVRSGAPRRTALAERRILFGQRRGAALVASGGVVQSSSKTQSVSPSGVGTSVRRPSVLHVDGVWFFRGRKYFLESVTTVNNRRKRSTANFFRCHHHRSTSNVCCFSLAPNEGDFERGMRSRHFTRGGTKDRTALCCLSSNMGDGDVNAAWVHGAATAVPPRGEGRGESRHDARYLVPPGVTTKIATSLSLPPGTDMRSPSPFTLFMARRRGDKKGKPPKPLPTILPSTRETKVASFPVARVAIRDVQLPPIYAVDDRLLHSHWIVKTKEKQGYHRWSSPLSSQHRTRRLSLL
nr:hypothetical protein Iba_chr02eCG6850 [Ipomoea batatas]